MTEHDKGSANQSASGALGTCPDVQHIERMDREALLSAWVQRFGSTAPKGLSQPMLRRFLAFEAQAQRHGGVSRAVQRQINKGSAPAPRPKTPGLRPGGRLIREWNGTTHVVDVTGDGFMWKGSRYSSLSAIARAITGARWSGPRFFGLTGERAR